MAGTLCEEILLTLRADCSRRVQTPFSGSTASWVPARILYSWDLSAWVGTSMVGEYQAPL